MALLTNRKYTFSSGAVTDDALSVVSFEGSEAVSRPYEFEISLVSDNADIDASAVLRNPACFTIHRDEGDDVDFNGILIEFEETREFNGYYFFKAVLAPKLWWLSLTHHNQVFLDQSVPEIIRAALEDGGLVSGVDFEFSLQGPGPRVHYDAERDAYGYPKLTYVCQYDESHFNFVSRWAEKEGIYYFFEQTESGEKVVFTDTMVRHADLPLGRDLRYSPPSGLDSLHTDEVIYAYTCRHNLLPKRVFLKDYNYLRPSMVMEGIADVDDGGRGENYIYGVNFNSVEEGNHLAQIRAQALVCRKSVFSGESSVPFIVPGFTFNLNRHYKTDYNRKFLVTDVTHKGHQTGYLISGLTHAVAAGEQEMFYANTFSAIFSDAQFRPEHIAQKPKISGTLHAKIDAETSGEYAELDEHGRYKVIMPFDRSGRSNGHASAWLRMMQPYAGTNQGMHFPLHKGTEVLLTFLNGDPDLPVIAGAVPNPDTRAPVTNANQTKSMICTGRSPVDMSVGAAQSFGADGSGNWSRGEQDNYIAFEDMKQQEYIKIHSDNELIEESWGHQTIRLKPKERDAGGNVTATEKTYGNAIIDLTDDTNATTQAVLQGIESGLVAEKARLNGQLAEINEDQDDAITEKEDSIISGTGHPSPATGDIKKIVDIVKGLTPCKLSDFLASAKQDSTWSTISHWKGEEVDVDEDGNITRNKLDKKSYVLPLIFSHIQSDEMKRRRLDITGDYANTAEGHQKLVALQHDAAGELKFEMNHGGILIDAGQDRDVTIKCNKFNLLNENEDNITYGEDYAEHHGDAAEKFFGDKYEEHHGDAKAIHHGDVWEEHYGKTDSIDHGQCHEWFMGGKAEGCLGANFATSLAETFEIYAGLKQEITLAAALEIFLGAKLELVVANSASFQKGLALEVFSGTKAELFKGVKFEKENITGTMNETEFKNSNMMFTQAGLNMIA